MIDLDELERRWTDMDSHEGLGDLAVEYVPELIAEVRTLRTRLKAHSELIACYEKDRAEADIDERVRRAERLYVEHCRIWLTKIEKLERVAKAAEGIKAGRTPTLDKLYEALKELEKETTPQSPL